MTWIIYIEQNDPGHVPDAPYEARNKRIAPKPKASPEIVEIATPAQLFLTRHQDSLDDGINQQPAKSKLRKARRGNKRGAANEDIGSKGSGRDANANPVRYQPPPIG